MKEYLHEKHELPKPRMLLPYVILALSLSLAIYAWLFWSNANAKKEHDRYAEYTKVVVSNITERLHNYAMVLRGFAGLFAVSEDVTRDDWRAYYEYRQVPTIFPGVQGIGFSWVVQPSELARHIQGIRAEGFPDYTVRPEGKRDVYTAIIFLEPFDKRNQRAFGYDMFSEPVRRAAMERARDTGMISLSGKVTLVQEVEGKVQAGFLMYVPIYAKGVPLNTTEERRAALIGYVYSPFRMDDLMQGIFSDRVHNIDFEIYDETAVSPAGLMYERDEHPIAPDKKHKPMFSSRQTLDLYGHQWTLSFRSRPPFEAAVDQFTSWGILAAGLVISLLLFRFIREEENTHKQAFLLAQDMTFALRQSEEKYRVLNENLPMGVSVIGPNMEVLAANATKRKWFPESDSEQHLPCYGAYNHPPRTEPCEGCPVVKTFHDGQMHTMEREANSSQGMRSLFITTVPLTDPDGKVISVHETVEDITERKQVEKEAKEATELLEKTFASILDAVFIVDSTNRAIITSNPAVERIFGYSQDEVVGRNTEFLHVNREMYEEFGRVILPALESDGMYCGEFQLRRKDGSVFPTEQTVTEVHDEAGRLTGRVSVIRDITARKRAEEELREYKEHLEEQIKERTDQLSQALRNAEKITDRISAILTSVADGLVVTNHEARVVLMNPAAEALLGIRFSEIVGQLLHFAIDDRTLRERMRVALEERESGYEFDFEIPGDQPDRLRILRAKTAKIETESKHRDTMVMVVSDVTIEREIDRMKTEFLSTAAHELRTPLTSIQGFSEILMIRDDLEPEKRQKYLSYINTQAVSLGRIISDLLDISRIESGKCFNLHKEAFDLGSTFEEIVELFQSRSLKHGFEINVPNGPLTVFADRNKLLQVLENLLSNAVKYSPAGGKIRITARKSEECEREKAEKSISQPSTILISVEDTGIGMTPDQVQRVFDKFWRADTSNKAIAGTGLGMSIVKYIVEAHGGTVRVESEYGKGTTVTVEVPGE